MVVLNMEGIIVDSVHDVFETLVYILPEEQPAQETDDTSFSGELISSIQISGGMNGVISMVCSQKAAQIFTKNMLGLDGETCEFNDICDCAGEIVNMVAGNIKTRCMEGGGSFALSIPTVMSGREMVLTLQDELCGIRVPFMMDGEELTFSLLTKDSTGLPG